MLSISALVVSLCLASPVAPAPSPAPSAAPTISAAPAAPAATPSPAATSAAPTELLGQPKTTSAAPVGAATTGAAPVSATPVGATQAPPGSLLTTLLPFGLIFLVFIGFQIFAARREQKKKDALLGGIATGDRVQTYGGIIGNVAEIKDGEVVLRVDEMTNTRIRFAKTAIATILRKHNAPAAELKPNGAKASA